MVRTRVIFTAPGELDAISVIHWRKGRPRKLKSSAPNHKTHKLRTHNLNPDFPDFKTLALTTTLVLFLCTCEFAIENQGREMDGEELYYPSSHPREEFPGDVSEEFPGIDKF